jgi:16S rRNA (adenine1518-N6/adenine1519-N6)-dimethyltransferase
LVIELLLAGVDLLAFTVQKEVADRLRAAAGTDDYGPLSVMAQLLGSVEVLRVLPPQAFWPAPKVDSALVRITPRPDAVKDRDLGRFVHAVFSYRRKTLRKALEQAGCDAAAILATTGFDGRRRPEEFTPSDFAAMHRAAGSAAKTTSG